MSADPPTLRITVRGLPSVERRLDRALLSVGADPSADLRLATVPPRWLVLRRREDAVEVRRVGAGSATLLAPGESVRIDDAEIALLAPGPSEEGLPVEDLAEALSSVEAPDQALAAMIGGLIDATGARTGAIILADESGYVVPIARHADGRDLDRPEELLSDTLVRDVLTGGVSSLCLRDLQVHGRYAGVPSVVSLELSSVLCVPMRLGARVLGAVYLGHSDPRRTFSDAHARDLKVLAAMALPLLAQLRRATREQQAEDAIIGESDAMASVRELVRRVAPSDLSVLVLGETGTGKEVTARAIHAASARRDRAMVALNCAAVPESLLAVELFGCKKGAYTGAVSDRKGRIEAADASTLFLDEVGDMPLPMQVALLRVLEEKAVTRVGENTERPVDFRLVAATSKDLDAEVEAGRFRKDLLYRLRELAIHLPALRDRGPDVLLLARLFLRQAEQQLGLRARRLAPACEDALARHAWPGNVRELRAVLRRASILCDGDEIQPAHLALEAGPSARGPELGPIDQPLAEARDAFTVRYVTAVLERHAGNREAAAAALGISVRSLYRYLS